MLTNYQQQPISKYFNAAANPLVQQGAKIVYRQGKKYFQQKLTDWAKTKGRRRIRRGYRTVRKTSAKSKKVNARQSKQQSGGYTQWETERAVSRLSKRISNLAMLNRFVKANQEKVIYKWNGVKNFDDHGYYWFNNIADENTRYLPIYSFDLTSCVNTTNNGTTIASIPMHQMYQVGGDIGFAASLCPDVSGGQTLTSTWGMERAPYSNSVDVISPATPHSKDILKWLSIKTNLWGCKARSTKFRLEIVQFKDEDLLPTSMTPLNTKRTSLFQSLVKPLAYNPIASIQSDMRKKYRVIKSETFIIQPTSTTETDQDPHVRTVNWFMRLDKLMDYAQTGKTLPAVADVADDSDYVQNLGNQNDAYIDPTKRMYLMLYATNFGVDSQVLDNTQTPSFDLVVRSCHQVIA